MAVSLRIDSDQIVTTEVRVDGTRIDDDMLVEHIVVENGLNRIPRAKIRLVDGSAAEEDFEISGSDDFLPGRELEILVGYQGANSAVFKGVINRHAITVAENGDTHLLVSGADKALSMTRQRQSRHFLDATDSDALRGLIQNAGLTADVADTGEVYPQAIQHNATDWDYMLLRATANGMVVHIDAGVITIAPPSLETPEFAARFGESLLSFEAEMDATTQVSQVEAIGWDSGQQDVLKVQSREPSGFDQGKPDGRALSGAIIGSAPTLRGFGDPSQRSLENWANAQHLMSRFARIRGRAVFPGNAGISAGNTLELEGVGKRFNGAAYVSFVRHDISAGEWITEAQFGIDPDLLKTGTDVEAPPAAGLRPGARGLQIGTVVNVFNDPLAQARVQVALPISDSPPLWMRMMAPYAGEETGMHFLPEVDDEVVVAFLDDDPDGGVCLGALNSGRRPPPEGADEQNTLKTLRTRSGLRLQFNDEDTSLLIETKTGRRLFLNDTEKTVTLEDDIGNQIRMAETGISMTSTADISIKADGNVTLEAGADMTMSAAGDAQVNATNVNHTADASFSAKGSASCKVEASGTTIVKGSIVQIN